ncbi:MAG: DegV family EDD domain-containing protein [Proteobacteria bacterium]|nr:DegV family EDD domain-containing protein [Pseudomonadota bacterium]
MAAAVMPRLDARELGRALRAGIHRVLANQEHLDRINVFPVPDGDTGTNLAITMTAMLGVLRGAPPDHAGRLLTAVADAALDGARGNSGAILAQFFLGLGDRAGHLAELSAAQFAEAVHGGAAYAREALADPREGTILTVLQDVATELSRLAAAGVEDFRDLVRRALARARDSLEATREQLDALHRANVVDAGAAGFVTLLEGVSQYLDSGELDESEIAFGAVPSEPEAAGGEARLEHRWCTECLVSGEAIDHRRLREQLAPLGSSLVVAGTRRKVRVHMHVADPRELFRLAAGFGAVSGEKADDMQRQQRSTAHAARRRIAIVTDSAADIPDAELERLDIHLVPVRLHFGERSFLDKVTLGPEEFYRLLATSAVHPKTSQPPAGDFRRLFEFLSSHYETVLSLNLTGTVSGTRQAAESAAGRVAAHARVRVLDTRNASAGQGLVVMYAAECVAAGLDAEAVVAAVQAVLPRTRTFACLATLDYAVRGGRVPPIARTLARWLRIVPLLATFPDGRVSIGGVLFGRGRLTEKFARYVGRRLPRGRRYRLIVGHGNAPEAGARLLERLTQGRDDIDGAWLVPLGAALGVHGGPGFLVVGVQEYRPPGTDRR